jgi:hypothetical protein
MDNQFRVLGRLGNAFLGMLSGIIGSLVGLCFIQNGWIAYILAFGVSTFLENSYSHFFIQNVFISI